MVKTVPIMSKDEECSMAFFGLIEWTHGVIFQSKRIGDAEQLFRGQSRRPSVAGMLLQQAVLCEHHFFVIAANKLLEYCTWARSLGLYSGVDFSVIDQFSRQDIQDLRNMREHAVEYFQGDGRAKDRWMVVTPQYRVDASSSVDSLLGGRLDHLKFAAAAAQLLPELLKELEAYLGMGRPPTSQN